MPKVVNLYEAKTQLSGLVNMAAQGEEIVIAKNGRPMARLVSAVGEGTGQRQFGQWATEFGRADVAKMGSPEWWREWKKADAELEREFALATGGPAGTETMKWPVTSSTRTPSSGSKQSRSKSGRKRSRK